MSDEIKRGEIVQLDPSETTNQAFGGCLMVVTEVREWGVQGYVQALGNNREQSGGQAHYRAKNGTFARTGGQAVWMIEVGDDE